MVIVKYMQLLTLKTPPSPIQYLSLKSIFPQYIMRLDIVLRTFGLSMDYIRLWAYHFSPLIFPFISFLVLFNSLYSIFFPMIYLFILFCIFIMIADEMTRQ